MASKKNHKKLGLLTLSLLVALASANLAHAAMRGDFNAADANHDGRVTLQEYQYYVTTALSEANGRFARRFKRLSPEEQTEKIKKRFEKADHGHKGYLDQNDWSN